MARNLAETLAVATAGGMALGLAGFPAGYLSGAMLAVAGFAIAGRPMELPAPLTRVIFVAIGISLGAVVTPETFRGITTYPVSIVVLIVAMSCVGVAGAVYLQVVHKWQRTDAYLAAAPGGMSYVLVLATDLGADIQRVAIVQSLRIVIVAVGLPAGLFMFGLIGEAAPRGPTTIAFALADKAAILVVASIAGAVLAYRFRMPGGIFFGAMFVSAGLHGSGWIEAVVPWWAATTAMIALGAIIGARFTNTPLRLLLKHLAAGVGSFVVAVLIAAIFGAGLVAWFSLPPAEVMIAFAPGSVDAMLLLAVALHLDPVYVGAHHVVRIFYVSLALPVVARRVARKPAIKAADSAPPREPPTFQD